MGRKPLACVKSQQKEKKENRKSPLGAQKKKKERDAFVFVQDFRGRG
jgi:hypothetical protein